MTKIEKNKNSELYDRIAELLRKARKTVVQTVNRTMVYTYFEIGRTIVEEEQKGKERAEYGKQIIKELSQRLTHEFGKGFSIRNLEQMRKFYLVYGKQVENLNNTKTQTLSAELKKQNDELPEFNLSWSHYLFLMGLDNIDERKFYEIEAYNNNWSLREWLLSKIGSQKKGYIHDTIRANKRYIPKITHRQTEPTAKRFTLTQK